MTNSNDCNGNRTRDLPACSAVPQPAATPRTLISLLPYIKSHPISDKRQSTIWMNINLLNFGSHTYDLHVCTEVRMHACIYIYVYIYICVCVSVRTCVCMHVFTYVCVGIYGYLYAYVYACVYVCSICTYVSIDDVRI